MSEINKNAGYLGEKRWKTSIRIPIELTDDEDYISHLKKDLRERCVKEYINNTEDSFKYRLTTDGRYQPTATLELEMEDLFALREKNRELRKEITEMVDKYNLLKEKARW